MDNPYRWWSVYTFNHGRTAGGSGIKLGPVTFCRYELEGPQWAISFMGGWTYDSWIQKKRAEHRA